MVLTVPAIWDEKNKYIMMIAAEKAVFLMMLIETYFLL